MWSDELAKAVAGAARAMMQPMASKRREMEVDM